MHMIIKKRKISIFIAKSLHCPIFNQKYRNEALHEEELEKIVVSANELTVHSVEKNCNNIVFVAIRRVI